MNILEILNTLNSLSPLAVIALLAVVIYINVWRQPSRADLSIVTDNHLHELPSIATNIRQMTETLQRMEVTMSEEFSYLRSQLK